MQQSEHPEVPQAGSDALDLPFPVVREVGVFACFGWLAAAARDMRANPGGSLFYGSCFAFMGLVLTTVFRHADGRHRDRRNQRAHGVAPHALDVARKLIAFKLQIMQHPPPGRRARAAQPDRLYDCQKEFHALPSSRKFFAMRRNA